MYNINPIPITTISYTKPWNIKPFLNCGITVGYSIGYSIHRVFKHSVNIVSKWITSQLFKSNHSPLTTCSYDKIFNLHLNEKDNMGNLLRALPFVRINGHYENTEWYRYLPLSKTSHRATSLFQKTCFSTCFCWLKETPKRFSILWKKAITILM